MLGYPDRGAQLRDEAEAHARRLGHPFDLGWALTESAQLFDCRGEPDEQLQRLEEAARLGRENSLPVLMQVLGPVSSGITLIRKGQVAEGMGLVRRGWATWEAGGGRQGAPQTKSTLVEGMAQLGDLAGGLVLIDEAIAQIERPGWEERCHYAEILRIKGGHGSSRRNPGSCGPRPATRG